MKLNSLLSYKSATKLSYIIIVCVSAFFCITTVFSIFVLNKTILELRNSVVIINKEGEVFSSSLEPYAKNRIFEYQNHIKTFYRLWYQFDQGSYRSNIEHALELIGDRGIVLLDNYIDQKVEDLLRERNVRFEIDISDIYIDMTSNPPNGYIYGVQKIIRKTGFLKRKLECSFSIYDVDRSELNPHGCKIGDWQITNDDIIK